LRAAGPPGRGGDGWDEDGRLLAGSVLRQAGVTPSSDKAQPVGCEAMHRRVRTTSRDGEFVGGGADVVAGVVEDEVHGGQKRGRTTGIFVIGTPIHY
jgi:hypothetical protein